MNCSTIFRSGQQPVSSLKAVPDHSARYSGGWRPGLAGARHCEVFGASREGSGAAAALSLALDQWRQGRAETTAHDDQRAVLWVQDRAAMRANGRPYRPGLPADIRHRVIHVLAEKPEDALFALEEGVRCRDLAFVIGEIAGNPRALDFTASRRLSLAAERHGVSLWLVRFDAARDLSSARMRWDVRSAVSLPPRWNADAPGIASWYAELFRARSHPPGEWIMRDDGQSLAAIRPHERRAAPDNDIEKDATAPDSVDLARPTFGRSLAAL